ncbi:MAG TPA: glycosyltransferase family 4 protein [Armatimonadota bacterium]|nr:glycosyltransferase family 4 protein [Armatimonadota bacterium]
MRLIQLTSGTGSFYCGTCMRDNALVTELRRQGHDALMVPLYLPPVLDETVASDGVPLFFGGINVYLQQKSALFRNTPRWLDRIFDAPGMLQAAASKAGTTSARELGPLTLSMLRGEQGLQNKELSRLVEWLASTGQPEVVCLSNVLLIGLARRIKAETGATILCFLNGEDAFLDSLQEPDRTASWREIAQRASDVDAFLPVSQYFGDLMRERCKLPAERVQVVYPGILLDGYAAAPAAPDPPVLGYLARMTPGKGLATLVEAYILVRANGRLPNLKLRVAGTRTAADEPFVVSLQERLAAAGLADDAEFLPNLDRAEKVSFLQSLSALSVPATYGEAFGLYAIEALAAGVPVVQPRHAAFPELVAATAGVLCEPDDPQSLATAVEGLLSDPAGARALGEQGRQAVLENFGVARMAENILRVCRDLSPNVAGSRASVAR